MRNPEHAQYLRLEAYCEPVRRPVEVIDVANTGRQIARLLVVDERPGICLNLVFKPDGIATELGRSREYLGMPFGYLLRARIILIAREP